MANKKLLAILGIVFLIVPLLVWSLWILTYYSNTALQQKDRVEIYLSYFPEFLNSVNTISIVVILFTSCSIILSSFASDNESNFMRVVRYSTILLSGSILVLQGWTML
jgi:hypothetical protein